MRRKLLEVQPASRLVHTEAYDPGTVGGGYPGNDALVTVSFAEEGGVTTLTTLIDFGSQEARDAAVATGMTDGMEQLSAARPVAPRTSPVSARVHMLDP